MFQRFLPMLCFVSMCAIGPVHADQAVSLPIKIGDSGSKYQKSIRLRGVASDVVYYDPASPAPPLSTKEKPKENDPSRKTLSGEVNGTWLIVSAVVLLVIGYLFARFGGGLSVSLKRDAENPERSRTNKKRGTDNKVIVDRNLEAILRIEDRRKAVILLAQSALAKALSMSGVLIQDSWTGRDALRRIPAESTYENALRSLVLASELVHFGGRAISEDEFRGHVENIRPLFEGQSA